MHELGHSVLHPNLSTPFLKENTLYSINKLELQVNIHASTVGKRSELKRISSGWVYKLPDRQLVRAGRGVLRLSFGNIGTQKRNGLG